MKELSAQNLVYRRAENLILNGINFSVTTGEIVGIQGRSGSGKSTLLRLLSGLLVPQQGEIFLENNSTAQNKKILTLQMANFPWPEITIVFQQMFLWPHLTVWKNICLPLKNSSTKIDEFLPIMEKLGILDLKNRYPHELSGGEKQRVALIRAIALKPSFLLLDEATSALDAKMVKIVEKILLNLKASGAGIVLVTHSEEQISRLANRTYLLENTNLQQLKKN